MERGSARAVVPFKAKDTSKFDDEKTKIAPTGRVEDATTIDGSAPTILRSTSKSAFYRPSRIRFPPAIANNNTINTRNQSHRVQFEENVQKKTDEEEKAKQLRANKFADWSMKTCLKRLLTQLMLISLALFAFDKRHLVLQIPKIGFVVYSLLGGPFPPYVDEQIFDYHEQWLQSGDVVISAPPKSGMSWMMYTIYRLRELDEYNNNCRAATSSSFDDDDELFVTSSQKTTSKSKKDESSKMNKDNKFVSIQKPKIRDIVEVSEVGAPSVGVFGSKREEVDQISNKEISITTVLDKAKIKTEIQSIPRTLNEMQSSRVKDDIELQFNDRFKLDKVGKLKDQSETVDPKPSSERHYSTQKYDDKDQDMVKEPKKQIRDIYEEVRWTEFVYYPGQSVKERIEILKFPQSTSGSFRILKSHSYPPRIPVRSRSDIRYIVLARNPLDSIESARDFLQSHHPSFSKMWGGFPSVFEQFPENVWRAIISTEIFLHIFVLNFFKSWWDMRRNENMLMVHYSDRIQNDTTELTRIARHLNLNVSKFQLGRLAKELTFENIIQSGQAHIFHLDHVLDPFKRRNLMDKDVFVLDGHNSRAMLNKGPNRHQQMKRTTEEELRFKHSIENTIRRYLEDDDAFSWLVR